jgi:hypothetical protein
VTKRKTILMVQPKEYLDSKVGSQVHVCANWRPIRFKSHFKIKASMHVTVDSTSVT